MPTVNTTLSAIATIDDGYAESVGFELSNGSGAALDALEVQVRVTVDAPWETVASAANDFTEAPAGNFPVWASRDPTTLPVNTNVVIAVVGRHWQSVQLLASVASGSTEVEVYFWSPNNAQLAAEP